MLHSRPFFPNYSRLFQCASSAPIECSSHKVMAGIPANKFHQASNQRQRIDHNLVGRYLEPEESSLARQTYGAQRKSSSRSQRG